jgi:hypothetical protein
MGLLDKFRERLGSLTGAGSGSGAGQGGGLGGGLGGFGARPAERPAAHQADTSGRDPDEVAVERYRYMLRTAPPETVEQAHAEAFAKLTPEQRRKVLEDLGEAVPASERATSDDPQSLARMATRAEMRQPGTMERTLGGRGGGMGMGGMIAGTLLASVAGAFIGTAIADAFLGDELGGDLAGVDPGVAMDEAGLDAPGMDAPGIDDPGMGVPGMGDVGGMDGFDV